MLLLNSPGSMVLFNPTGFLLLNTQLLFLRVQPVYIPVQDLSFLINTFYRHLCGKIGIIISNKSLNKENYLKSATS